MEESKTRGEASLKEKQERVTIEIEKVKKHVCVKTGIWQYIHSIKNDYMYTIGHSEIEFPVQ